MCVLMGKILPGEASGTLSGGGVSEWPKEHASKACEGVTPPGVRIPAPPLLTSANVWLPSEADQRAASFVSVFVSFAGEVAVSRSQDQPRATLDPSVSPRW